MPIYAAVAALVLAACLPLRSPAFDTLRIPASEDGFLHDREGDGVFERLETTDNSLIIRDLRPIVGSILGPIEERTVIEFDVPLFSANAELGAVAIEFNAGGWIQAPTPVLIEGFVGDGVVTREDATAPSVRLGSFLMSDLMNRGNVVALETNALASLLDESRLITLRFQGAGDFVNLSLSSSEPADLVPSESPPTLVLTRVFKR